MQPCLLRNFCEVKKASAELCPKYLCVCQLLYITVKKYEKKMRRELSLSNALIPGDRAYAYQFHEQTEVDDDSLRVNVNPEHLSSLPDLPK